MTFQARNQSPALEMDSLPQYSMKQMWTHVDPCGFDVDSVWVLFPCLACIIHNIVLGPRGSKRGCWRAGLLKLSSTFSSRAQHPGRQLRGALISGPRNSSSRMLFGARSVLGECLFVRSAGGGNNQCCRISAHRLGNVAAYNAGAPSLPAPAPAPHPL